MQSPRWTCGLCRWQTVQIHIVTNKNGAECVKWKYTRTTHKFLLHRWMLLPEDSYSDLMGLRRLSSVPPGFLHAFFPLKSDSQTKYKAILCTQKCARANCIKERCLYSSCSTIWILQKLILLKQTFPKTEGRDTINSLLTEGSLGVSQESSYSCSPWVLLNSLIPNILSRKHLYWIIKRQQILLLGLEHREKSHGWGQ